MNKSTVVPLMIPRLLFPTLTLNWTIGPCSKDTSQPSPNAKDGCVMASGQRRVRRVPSNAQKDAYLGLPSHLRWFPE